jgi:hypothetical protein
MKNFFKNPLVLIISSFVLQLMVVGVHKSISDSVSVSSGTRAAINLVTLVLGITGFICFILGVVLGIVWLTRKASNRH